MAHFVGLLAGTDAIHLATAIHYEAYEFHTFDGCRPGKPRNKDKKRCGLLQLNGDVAGHRLAVCKPSAQQLSLLKGVPPLDEKEKDEEP